MVSYLKFLRFVKEQLHEYLPDDYSHMKIEVIRANKKLGKPYDGIQVYEDDSSVGVSYDLHHYYSAMDDLSELPSVLQMIAFDVVQALDERPPSMMDMLDDPDYFLHHLIIDVVNLSANAEELKTMPHKVFDDMAVIYRLLYVDRRGEMYSTPVTDDIIREFDFDDDEVFEQAARNTSNIFPIQICDLNLEPAKKQPRRGHKRDENGDLIQPTGMTYMFRVMGHGSDCFFYPDFISKVKRIIPDSYFILPASTKDVILIHDIGDISLEFVHEMALNIYANKVPDSIRLTKSVYYYDEETDTIGPVDDYAHKMLQV